MKIQRAAKLLTKATKLFPVRRKALWRLLSRLLPLYLKKICANERRASSLLEMHCRVQPNLLKTFVPLCFKFTCEIPNLL